jgi:thiol-disulfide isomerase/thioredoxin
MILTKRRMLLAAAGATLVGARIGRKLARAQAEGPDAPELHDLSALQRIEPPQPLPTVAFLAADGTRQSLSAYAGRPVLLNFWATWCVPCVAEMPELDRLAAAAGPRLAVLPVSADRGGIPVAQRFLRGHGLSHLPALADPESEAVHALGLAGFPTTLLLDARLRLRARLEGPAKWADGLGTVLRLTA